MRQPVGRAEHRQLVERRTGGGNGDLLAHHGPDEDFRRIGATGQPDAGKRCNTRCQQRNSSQCCVGSGRGVVKVEQVPNVDQQLGGVLRLLDFMFKQQGGAVPANAEPPVAAGQLQGARISLGAGVHGSSFLDACHGTDCEKVEYPRLKRGSEVQGNAHANILPRCGGQIACMDAAKRPWPSHLAVTPILGPARSCRGRFPLPTPHALRQLRTGAAL